MKTLLITLLLLADIPTGYIKAPQRQYFLDKNKAVFVKYTSWDIQTPERWWAEYEAAEVDHRQALRVFAFRWISNYNLKDVAALSKVWNMPPVAQPAEPNEPAISDPNSSEIPNSSLGHICYTVGGKHHLYQDCRYIADKAWTPCVCDPNNICLTCAVRRLEE
jgi:hypothetical protein